MGFGRGVMAPFFSKLSVARSVAQFNEILESVFTVVSRIVLDRRADGKILDSAVLDELLVNLGGRMLDVLGLPEGRKQNSQELPVRVYLVTEVYAAGGHSRVLEDFIKGSSGFRNVVIVSDIFSRGGGVKDVLDYISRLGAEVVVVQESNFAQKTLKIMSLLQVFEPESCILFNHHQDVAVVAACLPVFCKRYFFYHHADHSLCLGATLKYFRHIDISPWQFERCAELSSDNIYIPISCADLGPVSRDFNVSAFVTCTAGSWIKFSAPYFIELPELIAEIVMQTKGKHIHIGELPEEVGQRIKDALGRRGLSSDAFFHVPWVKSLWLAIQELGVDLYLSSFPLGGGRGLVEVMGAGVPIAFHANPNAPYICGETFRYPGAICWSYLDELVDQLRVLTQSKLIEDSVAARQHYLNYFSWSVFEAAIANLGGDRNLKLLPSAVLPYQDGVRCYFEAMQLADFTTESVVTKSEGVQSWLDDRALEEFQFQLIEGRLSDNSGGPVVGVVILDRNGDSSALMQTISSLSLERHSYASVKILALSASALPAPSDGKLRFFDLDSKFPQRSIALALAGSSVDWFMVVNAGAEFTSSGLMIAALDLLDTQGVRAVYGDEIVRCENSDLGPVLKPDLNLDLLLSLPSAMARHWLFNYQAWIDNQGFRVEAGQAYELDYVLRLIELGGFAGLGHISEPIVICEDPKLVNCSDEQSVIVRHLKVRGFEQAEVHATRPGHYEVKYFKEPNSSVSILVCVEGSLARLRRCIESLLERTKHSAYEVLLLVQGEQEDSLNYWLEGVEQLGAEAIKVLRFQADLSLAQVRNLASEQAVGDYLLWLDAGVAVLDESWLQQLLNHAQRAEVGAVGAKLLSGDRTIANGGLVLGLKGPVSPVYAGKPMEYSGYMQRLLVDQNHTALSGQCLMVSRSLFIEAGGFDETPELAPWADVDLCLRLHSAGYLNVWTPRVLLLISEDAPIKPTSEQEDAMYARWLPLLARDPSYNPNFLLDAGEEFTLAPSLLSWKPLASWKPLPRVLVHPADAHGCGHYRIIQPLKALNGDGLVDGTISWAHMSLTELERFSPDSIVLQRQIDTGQIESIRRMKAFSEAFKIYELDDYLPNLPVKSVHRDAMPKDIVRSLRKGLSYVDRFVVSTEALADALSDMHDDIHVVHNRLYVPWWKDLTSQRRVSKKPRVGWAGGASHTGDLEMIFDVVKELADEVEWVFFGMCPDKLRPYVHELHAGVKIDQYPQKLAQMNLDLALAPVEQNLFNECKSNLRLLEYGACGFPVVCSDVRCYQGDLPVTRVRNRYKDWVEAIRMHLADLDATARQGDALRERVRREWMLEGDNLNLWRNAWLPS